MSATGFHVAKCWFLCKGRSGRSGGIFGGEAYIWSTSLSHYPHLWQACYQNHHLQKCRASRPVRDLTAAVNHELRCFPPGDGIDWVLNLPVNKDAYVFHEPWENDVHCCYGKTDGFISPLKELRSPNLEFVRWAPAFGQRVTAGAPRRWNKCSVKESGTDRHNLRTIIETLLTFWWDKPWMVDAMVKRIWKIWEEFMPVKIIIHLNGCNGDK